MLAWVTSTVIPAKSSFRKPDLGSFVAMLGPIGQSALVKGSSKGQLVGSIDPERCSDASMTKRLGEVWLVALTQGQVLAQQSYEANGVLPAQTWQGLGLGMWF